MQFFITKTFQNIWLMKLQRQCSKHFSEGKKGWQLLCTLCTAEFFWKCSGLFWEDSAYCLYNTMQNWGLEMLWVILWRECLLFVKTLSTAEAWKCSGFFCEDSVHCLYKHYTQLRSGNVLGYFVKTVLTVCTNTMQSWGLEMLWVFLWRECSLLV